METLKDQALQSCRNRGHHMNDWHDYSNENSVTTCRDCGMEVQVLTRPMPNQIDIGGEAVALNCTVTS